MATNKPQSKDLDTVDDAIVEVRDASVRFDMDRGVSKVLDEISLDVERYEVLGVVGESGSGKSMFASSLLNAVVDPGQLTGDIRYRPEDGEVIDLLSISDDQLREIRWEEISMVFQGAMSSFNPTLTIRDHFKETLLAHGWDVDEGMDHARQVLRDLYLDPDRVFDSYPHELSGGMTQRALIALALVLKPEVLVMDEPTAALDLLMQRSILRLLDDLQDSYDLTIVFITHDLPLVSDLADRIGVMYSFQFVEIGDKEDILQEPSHPYTRMLLNSVPTLDSALEEMKPIEGSAPDPVNVPTGCSYHPRCDLAQDKCRNVEPNLMDVGESGHRAACFYWEDAKKEIQLAVDQDSENLSESTTSQDSEEKSKQRVSREEGEPLISLEDTEVHFTASSSVIQSIFGTPTTVRAVDGVDFDIYENDVIALVGESGCGKTTLGKTAIAVQEPTSGTIRYRGDDIDDIKEGNCDISFDEVRQSLQMIHQDPGSSLNPNRTVAATLERPIKQMNPELGYQDRRNRIQTMLERVGMTPPSDYASRFPHQLSGGEKQRVALLAALLMNPNLILADEAVSALDVSLRVEMMNLMLDLQDEFDTSFLFISHNFSNARYLAAKGDGLIGVMYLGEIVEIAPAEELIRNPQHPYTKVLMWATAELGSDQRTEDAPIRGVDIPDPVDPPSGCRFHTRCPEAREVCTRQSPGLDEESSDSTHQTACFREYSDEHEYWDSDPLETNSN